MREHRHNKTWFGFLTLLIGIAHLSADFSANWDFFGINPLTSILVLAGIYLHVRKYRK